MQANCLFSTLTPGWLSSLETGYEGVKTSLKNAKNSLSRSLDSPKAVQSLYMASIILGGSLAAYCAAAKGAGAIGVAVSALAGGSATAALPVALWLGAMGYMCFSGTTLGRVPS